MTTVRRLTWDDWNVLHIARHKVTTEEVEQVCRGDPMTGDSHSGRLSLVGATALGRMLTVILAAGAENGTYYPITARPASRKERRDYAQAQGGRS